jgi:hypothetical protein
MISYGSMMSHVLQCTQFDGFRCRRFPFGAEEKVLVGAEDPPDGAQNQSWPDEHEDVLTATWAFVPKANLLLQKQIRILARDTW